MKLVRLAVLSLVLLSAVRASAQTPDPWAQASWHFGPLAVTPSFGVTNIGVDTNVFNSEIDPKSDFTASLGPRGEWWCRIGPTRFHGKSTVDLVYFAKYPSERSINQSHAATFEYPLSRLKPFVSASYLDTSDRPGFEIDARVRHSELSLDAGIEIRLTGKLWFSVGATQSRYRFTGDAFFQGTALAIALNRTGSGVSASAHYSLTPLTTVSVEAEVDRQRFPSSPFRDNDGVRVLAAVDLDPFALVSGRLAVGFRTVKTPSPATPDFAGLVADAGLSYTFRGMTKFGLAVSRDVDYSFDPSQPIYVQTGVQLSVTQALVTRWDAVARGGRYRLAYQRADPLGEAGTARVDELTSWGGGLGYHVGDRTRIGLNLDSFRRRSPLSSHDFKGLRAGLAVTYGF